MTEYEQANRDNPKFAEFWNSQRSLCQIQLEKKKLQQTSAEPDEKLFTEEELEKEGDEILNKMSDSELETMIKEIKENIAADSSFASELQFWQNLSLKVRQKLAVNRIERLYDLFVMRNKEKIKKIVELG